MHRVINTPVGYTPVQGPRSGGGIEGEGVRINKVNLRSVFEIETVKLLNYRKWCFIIV